MLRLIINNLKSKRIGFDELKAEELEEVLEYTATYSDALLKQRLVNHFTHIYDYSTDTPYWLRKATNVRWEVCFNKKENGAVIVINWGEVKLDDGLSLASQKHIPLLNSLKNWLLATTDPLKNGGKLLKNNTARAYFNSTLTLIDAILLRSEQLKLSEYHLSAITADFWLELLKEMVEQTPNGGVYNYTVIIKNLLLKKIKLVSDEEAFLFADSFPFIKRKIPETDKTLGLTYVERIKSCYWLQSIGYYSKVSNFERKQGVGTKLYPYLFKGRVISKDSKIRVPQYEELWLSEKKRETEYRSVSYVEDKYKRGSNESISMFINLIKHINVNIKKDNASSPFHEATKYLSVPTIEELKSTPQAGRTRTLHPDLIFRLTKGAFEYILEYQDDICNSILHILAQAINKSTEIKNNSLYLETKTIANEPTLSEGQFHSERSYFIHFEALDTIDSKTRKKLRVKQSFPFKRLDENKYNPIRNNESLSDLFSVLTGAVQYVLGIVTARRQNELVSLNSDGNLVPNLNPFDKKNKGTEYNLKLNLKKSGSGGEISLNDRIERPITTSIAKVIWKLEKFNQSLIKLGVVQKNNLSLFNNLEISRCTLSKINSGSYNANLDMFCDYFESDIVKYGDEFRRIYVRQHQLRRFFALMFFWQKRFQGLDALRWMLGHTDLNHLWHYISESETGSVLNGVKASVIVNGILDKKEEYVKLKTLDELKAMLAREYSSEMVYIDDLKGTIEGFNEDDTSVPHIDQIRAEDKLTADIEELINRGDIIFEPNFIQIIDEDGDKCETFNLAFQVKCQEE